MGSRNGLKGKKSKLFKHFLRLLDEIQPTYFILENVKMKQSYANNISKLIGVEPVMIDSNIVSYQRRKRLYWCNFDISSLSEHSLLNKSNILLPKQALDKSLYKDLSKERTEIAKVLRAILDNKPNARKKYHAILYGHETCSPTVHTIYNQHCFVYVKDRTIRQLHPIEIERLQTFPDNWTELLPKSKRCKVLGNAVTCFVISAIVDCLSHTINRS